MIINTANVIYHNNHIRNEAQSLRSYVHNINNFSADLNAQWHGTEMVYINQAINKISTDLLTAASNIDSICTDITDIINRIDEQSN